MKFEEEYTVGVKDIGVNNKLTNFAILSFLEEVASTHSSTVGYGVNDIETKKKVWILMDWRLKVFERPKYGDKLLLKTWGRPIEKHIFYTYRDFEVFCNNKLIAIATSKWVLFDLNTNKITKILPEVIDLYKLEDEKVFEEKDIPKVKESENEEFKLLYEVRRKDIDVNKHMHNLNYLSLAYEVLPNEIYENTELNNVRVMYKHQILFGEKVKCFYSKEKEKHIISIKSENEEVLHAIIVLD